MKKYLIVFTLFIALPVGAQTTIPVSSYTTATTPTGSMGQFTTDLSLGSQGSEVSQLQTWLIERGFDIPSVSSGRVAKGYFGQQTKNAVAAYQSSVGLLPTGIFGPQTRARINGVVAYPQPVPTIYPIKYAPVIQSIDAPTNLVMGQVGTWTVRATEGSYGNYYGNLTYSVDWGDVNYPLPLSYLGVPSTAYFTQNATFTHSYSSPGTYTIRFTVRNSSGQTTQSTVTVLVLGTGGGGNLRVISPNGGERWLNGSLETITWSRPYYVGAPLVDIRLVRETPPCISVCPAIASVPYTITTNIQSGQNSYSWRVGTVRENYLVPDGQYKIWICESGTQNCDASDGIFTITSTMGTVPDINVLSPNGGERWLPGTTQTITVNVSGDTSRVGDRVSTYLVDRNNLQTRIQEFAILPSNYPGVKSFTVSIPSNIQPGLYRILVNLYRYAGGTLEHQAYDYSDGYFTVSNQPNYYYNTNQCPAGYICQPASGY